MGERKEATEREREKEERGGEKGLSETAAIYETEWKRVLEGGRRPPPLIPPLNTAISTSQLHSAIPHFKGKISVRTTFSPQIILDELGDHHSSDGK